MLDLYLNPNTYDIVIENGDVHFVSTLEELCRQQVVVAIKALRGEWFRSNAFGVPWLENENNSVQLLGSKDIDFIISEVRQVILNEPTVISISKLTSNFDKASGQLTLDITVTSEVGPITISITV